MGTTKCFPLLHNAHTISAKYYTQLQWVNASWKLEMNHIYSKLLLNRGSKRSSLSQYAPFETQKCLKCFTVRTFLAQWI